MTPEQMKNIIYAENLKLDEVTIINLLVNNTYELIQTCKMFPEQYNIKNKITNKICGYILLKEGELSCNYPDYGGVIIFYHSFNNVVKGCFTNFEERITYLTACINAIDRFEHPIPESSFTNEEKTLKEILTLYHEHHLIKYHEIIGDMSKYLSTYDNEFKLTCIELPVIDDVDIDDIGNEFYIIPVYTLLKFSIENFLEKESIQKVLRWYLAEYQPSYRLVYNN